MTVVFSTYHSIDTISKAQFNFGMDEFDLIICDEAHRMSASYFGNEAKFTKRFRLGKFLGEQTRNLLLMTATPHNGKEEDFHSLATPKSSRGRGKDCPRKHFLSTKALNDEPPVEIVRCSHSHTGFAYACEHHWCSSDEEEQWDGTDSCKRCELLERKTSDTYHR